MENYDEKKAYGDMAERAIEIRGLYLNEFVYLERIMDEFLCRYFCPNDTIKRKDLLDWFIATDRTHFEAKRTVLKMILEKNFKDFLNKHDKLMSDLLDFMKERNVLAHHHLDASEESWKRFKELGEITILRFKNSVEKKHYSLKTIDSDIGKMALYISSFTELMIS